jgi:hypothetical protein
MIISETTRTAGPRLPRELMAGGSSVAVIARPISSGVLAHKPSSGTRQITEGMHAGQKETYYIAACAAAEPDDADDAYQVTAAWADHLGALACTEQACFPDAVSAR